MKSTKIIYWTITILFAAFMGFTAIPDIIRDDEAVKFIGDLGYPEYFVVFIGIAKLLGSIAILIPGFPRIREWAYAGLFFDLIAAVVSQVAVFGFAPEMAFMLVPFGLGIISYVYAHKLFPYPKQEAQLRTVHI